MSTDDLSSGLEARVRRLVELREQEEEKYGELLTLLDRLSRFSLPHEQDAKFLELKEALNRIWDIQEAATTELRKEGRFFWKDVAKNVERYLEPLVRQQREVNSVLAHIWNDYVESVARSLQQIREFHHTLILYFQTIIPVLDTKYREAVGISENFHVGLKDSLDLLMQDVNKRVESIRLDLEALNSLQDSVRSLHHLSNTLASEKGRAVVSDRERRRFPFSGERFESEAVHTARLARYVPHFQNVSGQVIDLGCGRGTFLRMLKEASVPASGVDDDADAVQRCKVEGLEIVHSDPLAYLQSLQENSLGGLFSSGFVQRLEPEYLLRLLEAAHSRLRTGAPILLDTINTASAAAYFSVFARDPGNRTLLQADSLKFLMAATGFQGLEVLYGRPVPATEKLRLFEDGSSDEKALFNENMSRLNHLLFADQAFAILARK